MRSHKSFVPAAVALLLTACTPSVNFQLAVLRPSAPEFAAELRANAITGAAPLTLAFTAATPEGAT